MQQKKELNIQMGSRIRKARLQAGLTQEAFAELLHLGPKHISAMERGIVGLSMETLQNSCQVLHVSADTLLFGDIKNLRQMPSATWAAFSRRICPSGRNRQ
ncbi:helix-turn-helix domain-containing protein [Anaerotignum lactatifermentans]|uniref:helix-turn-helix domain-containing protein n=1 Tax=Anaerotignum lactatifermentans TaxID=160404 RepID=UPI0018747B64|nr:helix-turn-helix transcriptional regulator [Anaerotignum lactatifermentans]MBE5076213.1 helix-turn-helix transcriptional regulator [Anaerotignum lactatifermentans]